MKKIGIFSKLLCFIVVFGVFFTPVFAEQGFFANIYEYIKPSAIFKPTIDLYRLFLNPSYAEQLSNQTPSELVKKLVDDATKNGQFVHCHADYCPDRLSLLQGMQEKLKAGVDVSSQYYSPRHSDPSDYFMILPIFGLFFAVVFFAQYFSELSNTMAKTKNNKDSFKEKVKAILPSLAKTAASFAGLVIIVNSFFIWEYLGFKVPKLISQSAANLVKDPETFRSTIRVLYDAVTGEKILKVFEKGIMQRF